MGEKHFIRENAELNNYRWKVEECPHAGCWCAIIATEDGVFWHPDVANGHNDEEAYIAATGCIQKEVAEHLVRLQNAYIGSR